MSRIGRRVFGVAAAALALIIVYQATHQDATELFKAMAPVKLRQCYKRSILCGIESGNDTVETVDDLNASRTTITQLKRTFHSMVTSVGAGARLCTKIARYGRAGDGGYDVCLTPPFRPEPGNCLVYSFGINEDWSFDEAIANYPCEVHSFDPSIGLQDHLHAPRVHFHSIGLWGSNFVNDKNWTLETLSTIRRRLGHEKRTIDVLKIDVESAEWPFLRDVVVDDPNQLFDVRQLLIEVHSPRFAPAYLDASDLAEMIYYFQRLLTPGIDDASPSSFAVFRNRQQNGCCLRFSAMMPPGMPEKCCHEVFMVNRRFIGVV